MLQFNVFYESPGYKENTPDFIYNINNAREILLIQEAV